MDVISWLKRTAFTAVVFTPAMYVTIKLFRAFGTSNPKLNAALLLVLGGILLIAGMAVRKGKEDALEAIATLSIISGVLGVLAIYNVSWTGYVVESLPQSIALVLGWLFISEALFQRLIGDK